MVKFIARINTLAGQEDAVAAALKELVAPSRAEEGCILYDACRMVEDRTQLLVLEEWASEEALEAHMKTPHFRGFLAKIGEALDGAPVLEMVERL
jgi:quinol monooxygenase YgiN